VTVNYSSSLMRFWRLRAEMEEKKPTLEDYARYFKVVGNPQRLAIVIILYAKEMLGGSKSLSFTQIVEVLEIPKGRTGTLNNYLSILTEADFIRKENGENKNPLYHLGETGMKFLNEFGLTEKLNVKIMEMKRKLEAEG